MSTQLRVLQLIQRPQLRGAEIFASQLSRELNSRGIQSDIMTLFDDGAGIHSLFPELIFHKLSADPSRRYLDFPAQKRLATLIRDNGYHIVQANAGDTLKYAAISKLRFGWDAKLVFRNANKMSEFFRHSLHRAINRWLLSRCDYFISVSENCRQDLIGIFPPATKRSATITIGTYLSTVTSQPPDEPVFINVGSFVPEKNHKFLIDLFAAWFRKWSRGQLWLVGDGALRKQLESQVEALGLQSQVKFWGYSTEAASLLRRSTVMIMPSLVEGLPAAILEGMACGVPVVAAPVGGVPELITDGVTGFCPTSNSIAAYVEAMEILTGDPVVRKRITSSATRLIGERYQMDRIAGQFSEKYKELVDVISLE